MKLHEHILISLGYATGIAFLAGRGLADPWIYVTAVVGGELIDIVDHPLYHIVYKRNEHHVVETRRIFREKGWKAAKAYLYEVEEDRQFRGLLLHNVYALSVIAFLSIILSIFIPAPLYVFIGLGTFFLHMLTDVFGDFKVLGHADNWLWVLSEPVIRWFGKLGKKLLGLVMAWGAFILIAFTTIGLRVGLQLANIGSTHSLLQNVQDALRNGYYIWIAYIPLLGLSAYHLALLTLGEGAYYKYLLDVKRNHTLSPYNQNGSLKYFLTLLCGKIPRNRRNLEIALLKMQADQEAWIYICATLIMLLLTTFTFLNWTQYDLVLVLTPTFVALLFGTFIHTSIGEIGGVLGVLSAWLLNLLLWRVNTQFFWGFDRGYLVFVAAAGAWIIGLLGGMLLKGQSRMSLVVFSLQLRNKTSDTESDEWLKNLLTACSDGLEEGYTSAHNQLFSSSLKARYVRQKTTDLMVAPYRGNPILGSDYHHLEAVDSYVPILRELEYVLCENKLTSSTQHHNWLIPVMPRYRTIGKPEEGDLYWENGVYHWKSQHHPLKLISAAPAFNLPQKEGKTWLLFKTRSEIYDHMVTRRNTIYTDLFIYPPAEQENDVTICGITRDITSTKEYATVESESYAGNILKALKRHVASHKNLEFVQDASARLFYPRISYYDIELLKWAETSAVLPSDHAGFPRKDLVFLKKSLNALPVKNFIPTAAANIRSKFMVLIGELFFASVLSALNFEPDSNLSQLVTQFIDAIFNTITK